MNRERCTSTARVSGEQTPPYAFILLSRYFDVTHQSVRAAPLQVEHTFSLASFLKESAVFN